MALQVGRAIGRGARRSLSASGIVALALTVGYQLVFVGALNTVFAERLPPTARAGDGGVGFTLPVSAGVATALIVVALLLGVGVSLVTARLLARDRAALSSLPGDLFTRRIGRAFLSALVVLLVPGPFLAVSLQFALFAVAVEDAGPVGALGGIGGAVGSALAFVSPSVGQVVSLVLNSAFVVLTYGIIADSFVQLRGGSATPARSTP